MNAYNVSMPVFEGFLDEVANPGRWGWLFSWGMYVFLLVAFAAAVWIFVDSTQKRKADKALVPRIAALVGAFFVMPAFIFAYTGHTDGVTTWITIYDATGAPLAVKAPIGYNAGWLAQGYGGKIALLTLLGVAVSIVAVVIYSSTVSRQRPSTEFVSALNNQFGELRQELQSVKGAQGGAGTGAETVAGAGAGTVAPGGSSARGGAAQTIMGGGGGGGRAAATIIERPGGSSKTFAELRVVSGSRVGQRWELPGADVKIGRDASSLVSVDDGKVSREHSKIRFMDGSFRILDLGSANGTLVNDQKITGETPLSDGDLIKVGDTVMAFKSVAAL